MRALPCASARTITHPLATMPTHGEDGRGLGGEVLDAAGFGVTTGADAIVADAAGCGVAPSPADACIEVTGTATSERTMLPAASVVSRGLTVSAGAAAMTRATVSARAATLGADWLESRCRVATFVLGSRAWEPSHTAAMNAAAAIHFPVEEVPFRIFSAVSVVPHHLHE